MNIEFAKWLVSADEEYDSTSAVLIERYSPKALNGEVACAVQTDDPVNLLLSAIRMATEYPKSVPREKPDELMTEPLGMGEVIY